ncbi:unnamed protein product, partial [Symbiodinium necroappetens]
APNPQPALAADVGVDWSGVGLPSVEDILRLWSVVGQCGGGTTTTTTSAHSENRDVNGESSCSTTLPHTGTSSSLPPTTTTLEDADHEEVAMMQRGAPDPVDNRNADDDTTTHTWRLSDDERDDLLSVGWSENMISDLNAMLDFLHDVGENCGVDHVAWALGMWAHSNILAETTVELVNDVMFRRVQGVPENRPHEYGTRGTLVNRLLVQLQ